MEKQRSFLTLDALRGVAAIAVIMAHTAALLGFVAPRPYLAVDFFFMLSGFVLTFAYQEQLDAGWSTFAFFKTRIARLYPLYILGLALGALFIIPQDHMRYGQFSGLMEAALLLLGIFFLPAPFDLAGRQDAFPFNAPSWSLFFEIIGNIVHAMLLRRRSFRFLVVATALFGLLFLFSAEKMNSVFIGVRHSEILVGLSRMLFSYTMGILLFRVWQTGKMRVSISPFLCALLLLVALLVPLPGAFRLRTDLSVIFLFFPVLLFVSANSQPPPQLNGLFRGLGISSYAVYVLHVPIGMYFEHVWNLIRPGQMAHDAPWPGIVFIALILAIAPLVDRVYDQPARAFLRRKLLGGRKREIS